MSYLDKQDIINHFQATDNLVMELEEELERKTEIVDILLDIREIYKHRLISIANEDTYTMTAEDQALMTLTEETKDLDDSLKKLLGGKIE